MIKEIYFKEEARDKIIAGINKLNEAVSSTMGPNGKTSIIPSKTEFGKYIVTKDGVSVAREVFLKDPVENIGASLIKEVAELQVDLAGDGTTTAITLATALVNNLKDFDSNDINKALDTIIPQILEQLKANARVLKQEDIKYVASISANNDIQIGNIIQQAYDHSSIVKAEESSNQEDSLELIEGMSLPVSYFSKHFINNRKKGECYFENPRVLVLDGKLDDLKPFKEPIEHIARHGEQLLIITEYISDTVLRLLESNVINDALKVCVIKTPGFGQHRKDLLVDICAITKATKINDFSKRYTLESFGKLKSCSITKTSSLLLKDDDVNLDQIINDLTEVMNNHSDSDHEKELIKQRIEKLTGKISIIKVGGNSEIEMKERFDRYDDAIKATACALEEGIVEGGGLSLYNAIPKDFEGYTPVESQIYRSMWAPRVKIAENGSVYGGNMFDQNIIDPLKVTRCALENAVSVAKTILSTDSIVIHRELWS